MRCPCPSLLLQLSIAFCLATIATAAVPMTRWANAIGTADERTRHLAVDDDENVFITGSFVTNIFIGTNWLVNQGPPYSGDFFVAKFDKRGSNVWARSAGGTGSEEGLAAAVDNAGNVYVVADMRSTLSFGSTNLVMQGFNAIFLAKYDRDGSFLWARQVLNVGPTASDICVRGTNLFLVTTGNGGLDFGQGPMTNTVFAAARYDSEGTLLAVRTIARGSATSFAGDYANDLFVDADANGYATFSFSDSLTLGNSTIDRSAQGSDALVAKWDAAGNVLWFHQLMSSYSSLRALSPMGNGEILVLGSAPKNGRFADQLVTNAFLARLSSEGAVRSIRSISTNAVLYDIAADADGDVVLCGSIPAGNGQFGSILVTNRPGFTAPMVAKLDGNGEVLWIKTADSPNTSDWGQSFSLGRTARGAIYVTGLLSGNLNFDTVTASGVGYADAFLIRIDPEPPLLGIFTSGANAVVSWPVKASDWLLQRQTHLGAEWESITNGIFQDGELFVLTNAPSDGAEFFRLRLPD